MDLTPSLHERMLDAASALPARVVAGTCLPCTWCGFFVVASEVIIGTSVSCLRRLPCIVCSSFSIVLRRVDLVCYGSWTDFASAAGSAVTPFFFSTLFYCSFFLAFLVTSFVTSFKTIIISELYIPVYIMYIKTDVFFDSLFFLSFFPVPFSSFFFLSRVVVQRERRKQLEYSRSKQKNCSRYSRRPVSSHGIFASN